MKQIIIVLVALFTLSAVAQEPTFKKFYKAHKDQSAFSINLSASFAGSFLDKDDNEDLSNLIKKSSDFKLMVFKNEKNSVSRDFKKYLRRYNIKTLARVSDNGNKAGFFFIEKGGFIREIIVKANSDNDKVVLMGLKTKITKEELAEMFEDSNLKITSD